MCLIVYKGEKDQVAKESLESAFKKNDDGWGMMRLTSDGDVYVEKGLHDFNRFYNLYETRFKDYECAIHFRSATQGQVSVKNAHPYQITKDRSAWLMHNGIIWALPQRDTKKHSDSWNFARTISLMSEKGWLADQDFLNLIQAAIGFSNKCVILDKDQGFIILNEDQGRKHNGVWYSNTYAWDPPQDLKNLLIKEKAEFERKKREAEERDKKTAAPIKVNFATEYRLPDNFEPNEEDQKLLVGFLAESIINGRMTLEMFSHEKETMVVELFIKVEELEKGEETPPTDYGELKVPASVEDLHGLSLPDFRETIMQYPEEMADLFFDVVNPGCTV